MNTYIKSTRSPAKPVESSNTVDLLKRITILNLIRDAFQIGINVRSIPITPQKCTRIVKEILQKLRPNFHCVPRYYCVAKTKAHRLSIGDYQVTLCPWAVEIIPLTNEEEKIPVITDACKTLPYEMSKDYNSRIIKGPIGSYANANGFDLMYMTQRSGNIIIWAGSSNRGVLPGINTLKHRNSVRTLMKSMISPLAFCRCISYIYDELKASGKILSQAQTDCDATQKMLGDQYKKKKKVTIKPKVKEIGPPQAVCITKPRSIVAKKIQTKPEDCDEIRNELKNLLEEMSK